MTSLRVCTKGKKKKKKKKKKGISCPFATVSESKPNYLLKPNAFLPPVPRVHSYYIGGYKIGLMSKEGFNYSYHS